MSTCIVCQKQLLVPVYWSNFLFPKKNNKVCSTCASGLQQMKGKTCVKCSRSSLKDICSDCERWNKIYQGDDPLEKNVSLYTYNRAIQQLVYTWKYEGDYVIGDIFQTDFHDTFKRKFGQIEDEILIVPIPLSEKRLHERAFNQAKMLASFLTGKQADLLTRKHGEKQAKKTRLERMNVENF